MLAFNGLSRVVSHLVRISGGVDFFVGKIEENRMQRMKVQFQNFNVRN